MDWGKRKFYVLFVCLVIISLALMMFVYDKRGKFGSFSPKLREVNHPKIKPVGEHDAVWSLADYGFDSPVPNYAVENDKIKRTEDNVTMMPKRKKGKTRKRKKNKRKRKKGKRKFQNVSTNTDVDKVKSTDINQKTGLEDNKNDELKRRLPNAIIIGSKKCGTRALISELALHSTILSAGKEIHFFDRNFDKGFKWYTNQMPLSQTDEVIIEKTPGYFVTKEAPERIYNMQKMFSVYVKLIVIVRDPVVRAISDYAQGLKKESNRKKKRTFEQKVFLSPYTKTVNKKAYIIRLGLYAQHLERWLKYFPKSQIHFVSGEELIAKPWAELEAVQEFLNVTVDITKDNFWYNETKKFYCVKKKGVDRDPKCFGETKGRKHPDIYQGTISALREFYKPYNKKLYKMVGRNFGWPE